MKPPSNLLFLLLFPLMVGLVLRPVHSMEFRERIKATILKVSPDIQRVIIDRGKEDGIVPRDTAYFIVNIENKNKYLFTGVALVVEEELSEWVVHRTYARKAISENTKVVVRSNFDRKKPKYINFAELESTSFLRKIREEHEATTQAKKDKIRDEQSKVLLKKYALERYKNFFLPDVKIEFNFSPLIFKSPPYTRSLNLGSTVTNVDQKDYLFQGSYEYKDLSQTSRVEETKTSYSENKGKVFLDVNDFWREFNSYSLLEYKQQRDGFIYPIRFQLDVGPLGLKYQFPTSFKLRRFNVIYIPLVEFYSGDKLNPRTAGSGNTYSQTKDSYWRHAFFAFLTFRWGEKFELANDFSIRPVHDFGKGIMDFGDCDLSNKLAFSYLLTPDFRFSLETDYSWDIRRKENLGIPSGEWTNTVHLHYGFELKNLFF